MLSPRNIWRDLALLLAVCLPLYFLGLTDHGCTNWQEGMRVLVARDMHDRGDWIVPTVHGQPYLAKPPMVYWAQIALAEFTGRRAGLFELRLAVALSGLLGVVALYLFARRLLREAPEAEAPGHGPGWADTAALWSALFLATGILYTRSSRIGELDILLAPFTVIAVGAVASAWRLGAGSPAARWRWIILAALAASGAGLTKGPPGVLVIALAAYGGIALHAACRDWARLAAPARAISATLALAGAIVPPILAWPNAESVRDLAGVVLFALAGGAGGLVLGRLADPARLRRLLGDYSRTHPIVVLGAPLLALYAWGRALEARIGADAVRAAAAKEAMDNLRALDPGAPVNFLEAFAYGVGAGSLAAIIALAWLVKDRPRLPRFAWVAVAWAVLSVVVFSLISRGTIRYLTPAWPGIALLGGLWFASALGDLPRARQLRAGAVAAVIVLAAAQTWWYADGRDRSSILGLIDPPPRSSRAFMAELLATPGVEPDRLGALDFWFPELDYYADAHVRPITFTGLFIDYPFQPQITTLAALRQELATTGRPITLILRERPAPGQDGPAPVDLLAAEGLIVEPLPIQSDYVIDRRRVPVMAAIVRAPR